MDDSKANQNESNLTFVEKVQYGLNDIELRDKLCVSGYLRENAINKHNMDIPAGIINYCVIFLFFVDERDFYLGNLHKLETTRSRNKHRWTMFISTSKTKLIPPKTIKRVRYYLHPTFSPPEKTVYESPFYLRRLGWGTFIVEAKIIFEDKYKRNDCFASHYLSFGSYASITQINLDQNERDGLITKTKDYQFQKAKDYPVES